MRRREFLTLVAGATAAPLSARTQEPVSQIGILNSISFGPIADRLDAFLQRLEEGGFVYGRNLEIAGRSAEGHGEWLAGLADDLVRLDPRVIVCLTSANAVRAARAATSSIPIVFAISGDPLELGLVLNLDHPEGNVTGAGRPTEELNPQRLKVISDLVPPERPLAFLLNSDLAPAGTTNERIEDLEAAAHAIGRRLLVIDLAGQSELASVYARMVQQDVAAFVISTEALFSVWRDQVIGLAARYRIGAIFPNREYVFAGGLISFGADLYEHYRVAGAYTARILKGETPHDLPVQIPTKYDMVINLRTANALGLAVPPKLRAAASEVIE
jgi:putative tryptophan/tyrosine transport system substrate-binding protein